MLVKTIVFLFSLYLSVGFVFAGERTPLSVLQTNTKTNQMLVTWEEIEGDFHETCKGIKSSGRYIKDDGCAFWSKDKKGQWHCLIFTKPLLDESAFSNLVKRCFIQQ